MILKLIYTYQYNVLLHGKHGILSEFWITAFISWGEMCYHLNLFIEMLFLRVQVKGAKLLPGQPWNDHS